MEDQQHRNPKPQPWHNILVLAALVTTIVLVLLASGCCSARVVEHIIHQRDTTYIEREKVDSVYRRDSVFVKEKGDTIYIYKEKIRDRYRYVHDTIRLVKADSIVVERVIEVEKEKPLSWWQSARMEAFWWLAGACFLLLLWTFRKTLIKLLSI